MKRSTARWTMALTTAAMLSLPAVNQAQTPTSQSPTTQPPAATASTPDQSSDSPQAHLRKAEEALNGIQVTGRARTRVNELKQYINKLERVSAGNTGAATTARPGQSTAPKAGANWQTDVAAIDRILTELIGAESTTGAPAATGTTGKAPAAKNQAELDEAAKAKLSEVRTHITAFAAAMAAPAPDAPDAPQSAPPATPQAEPPAAASQPPSAPATGTPGATGTTGTMTGTPGATGMAGSTPQQPTSPQSQPAETGEKVDAESAKRHLTAARDTLSQMTQLPAASQLTGEARTQVSELIANFNTLITTTADWPAAYAKVDANLNALIGSQTTDESPARTSATAGAVGTSGTVTVDPEIKAKLIEFRGHLEQFEKAAGGVPANPTATPATDTPPEPAAGQNPSQPATQPPTGAQPSQPSPSQPSTMPQATFSRDEALQHVQAIEAILSGQPMPASSAKGTTGTSGSTTPSATSATGSTAAAPVTLDAAKVQQLRTHLAELRRILGQSQR